MTWAKICHCGHDKDTHFEKRETCLGVHCECRFYVDREEADVSARTKNPETLPSPAMDTWRPGWPLF